MCNGFDYLSPRLQQVLAKYGYRKPTLVQSTAARYIKKRANVVIIAPTGYGKTEAAVFPILDEISTKSNKIGIKAIYITPLRALNRDIFRRLNSMAHEVGARIAIRHGDTSRRERREIIENPPDILVTTPESLQIILVGKRLRSLLEELEWVIIDEIHELVMSKRGVQLAVALERLQKISKKRIQRIGLSATIGDPELVAKFLAGRRQVSIISESLEKKLNIDVAYRDDFEERLDIIKRIINESEGAVLIFTNTRDTAEALASKLKAKMRNGIAVHHGSLDRDLRIESETKFKKGLLKAMVSTSSLELGIDIGEIVMVIQYMSPRQVARLVQRVGRSSHRPGLPSNGIIIAANLEDLMESAVIAARARRGNLERPIIYRKSRDVLAHQIIGIVLEKPGIHVDEVYKIVNKAYPYKDLTFKELKEIVNFLSQLKLLRTYSEGSLKPTRRSYEYYFENLSTIPYKKTLKVIDTATKKVIGFLDEDFVRSALDIDEYFILAGRVWKVDAIDYEEGILRASSEAKEGILPAWTGEDIPVDYCVSRELGALKRRLTVSLKQEKQFIKLLSEYGLEKNAEKIKSILTKQLEACQCTPSDKEVLIESLGKTVIIHSHIGTRANTTLGLLITYYLSRRLGIPAKFRAFPHAIVIYSREILPLKRIIELLEPNILSLIEDAIVASNLYSYKLLHVARRFGIISKKAEKIPSNILKALLPTPVGREAIDEVKTAYLDIFNLKKWLEAKNKKWIMKTVSHKNPCPLTESIINIFTRSGYSASTIPAKLLINVVKRRLLESRVKLVCLNCGWSWTLKVKDFSGNIECPLCHYKLVAPVSPWDSDAEIIIRKKKKGKKLSDKDKVKLKELVLAAKLLLKNGRKALLTLAGRGIGPKTSARILSKSFDEEELIKNIIEAERNFARTHKYWKK